MQQQEQSRSSDSSSSPVDELVQRFVASLNAKDDAAIAALFAVPSVVVLEGSVHLLRSPDDVRAIFRDTGAQYEKYGIARTRGEVTHQRAIGGSLIVVDVRYPWLDAQDVEIGGERSTLVLRREADAWRIRAVVMRGTEKKAQPTRATQNLADAQVLDLLEDLHHAITRGEGAAAAACFSWPCLVVGADMVMVIEDDDACAAFFGNAREQYNAQGIAETRPEIQTLQWSGAKLARVEVRWPWLDDDGDEKGAERSTYVLRRDGNDDLKIQLVIFHGTENVTAS